MITLCMQDSSFRQIIHVLHNVNRDGGDIFGEMDSNILFDIKMITTDKHNRWKLVRFVNLNYFVLFTRWSSFFRK